MGVKERKTLVFWGSFFFMVGATLYGIPPYFSIPLSLASMVTVLVI